MMIMGNEEYDCQDKPKNLQASIDDITMLRNSDKKKHVFRVPKPIKKSHNKKSFTLTGKPKDEGRKGETDKFLNYKLSPKVFGHLRPISISFENLSATKRKLLWTEKSSDKAKTDNDDFSVWGSLQELRPSEDIQHDCVYGSEPNLQGVEVSFYF